MCASSPRNVGPYRYQTDREGGKRWTPFINVFVYHMLRVCVAFPFSSSLERPYGLYIHEVCSQGIEIYVRHMVHDIRCMNACEYYIVISTLYLRKKNRLPARLYIVFRVSFDLTCIIILRPAACVRNLCMVTYYNTEWLLLTLNTHCLQKY